MTKELLVGIALGAVLQGSFVAAFGNAKEFPTPECLQDWVTETKRVSKKWCV